NGENGTSIEDLETGCSENAYDDRTDESVDLAANTVYLASITSGTSSDNAAVWIDFNDDGFFDPEEMVGTALDLETSAPGSHLSMDIPEDAELGEHRMRVMVSFSADPTTFDACNGGGALAYGETHDYMGNILDASDCAQPGDLAVDDITEDSAHITWTPGSDETEWDVLYGEQGFDPSDPDLVETASDDPEITLVDLDPNTKYEVYVKGICSDSEESPVFGPVLFRTAIEGGYCMPVFPIGCGSSDFIDDFVLEGDNGT